jgi:ribosomal protein S27AE
MFNNRTLIIGTKHGKEKVIAPLFKKEFNINCKVASNFDTDSLGTFTGEIERIHDPLTTLRNKCLKAMKIENADLAVANEGSFGPHPQLFFAPSDNELAIFIDKKNDIEIIASETSLKTNFAGCAIESYEDLLNFADNSLFPSHAIILRKDEKFKSDIFKGISSIEELSDAYHFLFKKYGTVFAETDMRAMQNPSRMLVIEKVFEKLISKIKNYCPNCNTIGFDVVNVNLGLPCSSCGFKTNSALSHRYQCRKCNYTEEKFYPNGIFKEEPMYCDICNP